MTQDMSDTFRIALRAMVVAVMTLLAGSTATAQDTQENPGVRVHGNVYGGGNAADVQVNTTVNISTGTVLGNVYGGGNLGDVGKITKSPDYNYTWIQSDGQTRNAHNNNTITDTNNNTGICTVTISGGTIGSSETVSSEHGNVFGAGKGEGTTFWCEKAIAYATNVSVSGGTVNGNVYGGGQVGRVEDDAKVTIRGAAAETGADIKGSVFGAGAGLATHGYSALVRGNTKVTVEGYAKVAKSVYGGGETASVGRYGLNAQKMPNILVGGGKCELIVQGNAVIGENVFGACKGVTPEFDENNKPQRMTAVEGVSTWETFDTEADYFTFLQTLALATRPEVTINGNATVNNSVFGGGELGLTKGSVIVNIQGGTIEKDVYGGGALADTNTTELVANNYPTTTPETNSDGSIKTKEVSPTTTVNLTGGIIKGDAYGGGLGQLGDNPVEAVVHGDIYVTLGGTRDATGSTTTPSSSATGFYITNYTGDHSDVIKSGRIFGCNNLNGSPQGDVTVTVWKTVKGNTERTDQTNLKNAEAPHSYHVAAVYGGGNLANYAPTATGKKTYVRIETCDVSIESVYGGGNAAEVPETNVLVRGAYEINEVFGGGNGKDPYTLNGTDWIDNSGANVRGNATTLLTGGLVHGAYGGSNNRGTIFGNVSIDTGTGSSTDNSTNAGCKLDVEKLVGAGKDADVNGDLIMVMGCKPDEKIPVVYAGADNANVNGDVMLTITSGKFGKVFGGNNAGGYILGRIRLNIEETADCDPAVPIEIDELYLGGNEAEYSMYGYYNDGTDAEPVYKSRTAAMAAITDPDATGYTPAVATMAGMNVRNTAPYAKPELNIISCTRIDKVYGGGYGAGATLYGDPIVNINMIPGVFANNSTKGVPAKMTELGLPSSDNSDKLGIIGDVFGGGNAAKIEGSTTVNIGTAATVNLTSIPDDDTTEEVESLATVKGAYIVGNVYGGGNEADVTGNTFVNICAKETDGTYTSVAFAGASGVMITSKTVNEEKVGGNVYGGGKGKADTFTCKKAMIGTNDAGLNANYTDGNTSVVIGNGTVNGTVYGGGEIGRVEMDTKVTIGLGKGATSAPVIKGDVFGAGKGLETHGYAALVRGNPTVTIQADAKVLHSVYGGGEIASVARYQVVGGVPVALAGEEGNYRGYCTVNVLGNAEIGPEENMVMHHVDAQGKTVNGSDGFPLLPDDAGHVFAAGKGVLPKIYSYTDNANRPKRMMAYDDSKFNSSNSDYWAYSDDSHQNVWQYFKDESEYFEFIQTLALATQTEVTISGNAFVKGSVYGGSENGLVQYDTHVTIEDDCQIGCGKNTTERHPDAVWGESYTVPNGTDLECASWEYDPSSGAPYDPYAKYLNPTDGKYYYDTEFEHYAQGGSIVAKDGHTYYGNVFGGGSGSMPYFDSQKNESRYLMSAGWVKGNTYVTINGGHILTNVYGGNEATNVDGTAYVTMTDGTVGVPRTLAQIDAHPVTCYVFGAGKGDQRIFFNKDTNVKDAVVNITGGRIYGSVFGGGEDGHVLRDVQMTIGEQTTAGEGDAAVTTTSGPMIGTWGTSYVDGNVFGGGRGFGGDAYTAGNVAGSVKMEIKGGTMLGSIYGGGRLASVGYGLYTVEEAGYGLVRDDDKMDDGTTTSFFTTDGLNKLGRGHIDITISGGMIGNTHEYIVPNATNIAAAGISETDISKWTPEIWTTWKAHHNISKTEFDTSGRLTHTKGGNVFAGGMGRFHQLDGITYISAVDWWKLGCVRSTKLTITGGTIKSNVYGGGELGQVVGHHTTKNAANEDVNVSTEISISGSDTQIGTPVKNGETTEYTFGSVFGGGYGSLIQSITVNGQPSYPRLIAGLVKEDTKIDMQGGAVKASIYGGGEMASVGEKTTSTVTGSTYVTVRGGTVGIAPIKVSGETRYFGGAKMGNVYGGGSGDSGTVRSGRILKNTDVTISGGTIYHNIYGGGAYGSVGDFDYDEDTDNNNRVIGLKGLATADTGIANVTITGGTIGYDGKENGMVFGSSRGLEGDPETNDLVDNMAWVYDTYVTIGTSGATTGPLVKGSVYGGGENGHNFHDANVKVYSGTIGIEEDSPITDNRGTPDDTSDDITYTGARYPNRGNVYGGGCGTDTYTIGEGDNKKICFDFNAGVVLGNATVEIAGGHVVHNVYGGGAMGSVGTFTLADADYHTANPTVPVGKPYRCADGTGLCTVTVSGGTIGNAGAKMAGYGIGGPDDYGHVFGAGRGEMHDPNLYPNVQECAYFNNTAVTISGGFLTGSVYGGSESGHVLGDTEVIISGGQIGCGQNATEPYGDEVWADGYTPTKILDCASWPFVTPFAPYDPYANATGNLDQYKDGHSTDGGRLEASDGHTYYGNVFGGGSGSIPYFDATAGISKYLSTAGTVEGSTTITISDGHILTNVYGGCEATNVLGSATITMTGGTVGVPRTVAQIAAHPLTGYIFGAGKGDQRIFFNKDTNVDRASVTIEGGRVYGSVYGGGEDGHVLQNVTLTIGKTGEEGPTIGTWGTSYFDGNVFGGGRGFGGEALTAGNVGGSIDLNIISGKILGSVYGGGRLASVGYGLYLVDEEITEDGQTIKPYGILRPDDKYDGSYSNPSAAEASDYYNKGRGYINVTISGGTIGNDNEYIYNPSGDQKATIPYTTFDYQNRLQYTKGGNVFAAGMGRLYGLDGTTLLPLWPKLGKCKQVTLNMIGGTVKSSVYGGAELGVVAQNATVNINGGTVGTKVVDSEDATKYYYFGSVFGGGKGSTANVEGISEAGTTGGNVEVNLNETVAANDEAKGAIVRQVFGCNDMNGSPKGTVTVHVYATQSPDKDDISTKPEKDTETFDVEAVYGGGNLAAYEPTDLATGTNVIIDGCGLTSIRQVYGGGNAASTPATDVEINGTYEILELFGGGNGFDKLPNGDDNPGANVGYRDYHLVEDQFPTKEDRVSGERFAEYRYGTGEATVNIKGGTIHRVFGGSNTKGNVRITAVTMLEEVQEGGEPKCKFNVDEAYGGGKSAPMDAEAKLLMACIPGLDEVYGGAEAADVRGDVTLTITNGNFNRVFGGNNLSGTISGKITVNVEETGCRPIVIGELYGGGNLAPYSIYGYNDDGTPKESMESGTVPFDDPVVNVRSFTSIGAVYGGGYGEGAKMIASPTVNINESVGTPVTYPTTGDYDENGYKGKTITLDAGKLTEHTVTLPAHKKGKIGAIGDVFGGGNAAEVKGNTTVNVGTLSESTFVSIDDDGSTTDTDESKKTVIGADIRGNVYGGGNNAEVTGDTNVVIGQKAE